MVVRGYVKNGVIVVEENVHLQEGWEVEVNLPTPLPNKQSVLDIAPVHIGAVLRPLTYDDDLLEEMLEDRR